MHPELRIADTNAVKCQRNPKVRNPGCDQGGSTRVPASFCGVCYSKAQSYRLKMARLMDRTLADADIPVSPATPMKAIKLAGSVAEGTWEGRGVIDMNRNTCPTNLTGHPALSAPSGFGGGGLPTGIQLMGRRWDEATLIRAAYAGDPAVSDEESLQDALNESTP